MPTLWGKYPTHAPSCMDLQEKVGTLQSCGKISGLGMKFTELVLWLVAVLHVQTNLIMLPSVLFGNAEIA